DVEALSAAQIDDVLLSLQRRSSTRAAVPAQLPPVAAPTYAYTPVFYPGTTVPDGATKVTLGVGEERTAIDFVVQLTRMATIAGELTDGGMTVKPLIINPIGVQMPSLA